MVGIIVVLPEGLFAQTMAEAAPAGQRPSRRHGAARGTRAHRLRRIGIAGGPPRMYALIWLLPVTLALGAGGLALFLWCARSGQFDDLDGAAWRILRDADPPLPRPPPSGPEPRDEKA
jgi:cbb3-type cytochrome oxidase maturation protein